MDLGSGRYKIQVLEVTEKLDQHAPWAYSSASHRLHPGGQTGLGRKLKL